MGYRAAEGCALARIEEDALERRAEGRAGAGNGHRGPDLSGNGARQCRRALGRQVRRQALAGNGGAAGRVGWAGGWLDGGGREGGRLDGLRGGGLGEDGDEVLVALLQVGRVDAAIGLLKRERAQQGVAGEHEDARCVLGEVAPRLVQRGGRDEGQVYLWDRAEKEAHLLPEPERLEPQRLPEFWRDGRVGEEGQQHCVLASDQVALLVAIVLQRHCGEEDLALEPIDASRAVQQHQHGHGGRQDGVDHGGGGGQAQIGGGGRVGWVGARETEEEVGFSGEEGEPDQKAGANCVHVVQAREHA
mmetsp:Transcript_21587/g.67848  ORF Transcript_21587/g.67848 Transcript_21587/m.67848 type:complete len:303 (+) Transcript_21587:649-1557(+)